MNQPKSDVYFDHGICRSVIKGSGTAVIRALIAIGLLGVAFGCGRPASTSSAPGIAPDSDPIIDSVADECGIETYVGPLRGYEEPWVKGSRWTQTFDYSSGFGDEVISGYNQHWDSVNQGARNPRCEKIARVLEALHVEGDPTGMTSYALSLEVTGVAEPFPVSAGEVGQVAALPVNISGKLVVKTIAPCANNDSGSCMESVSGDQEFRVDIQCSSDLTLKRLNIPESSYVPDQYVGYAEFYSLDPPDGCEFAARNIGIRLFDGSVIPVSLSGVARTEATGARLRILHIALQE